MIPTICIMICIGVPGQSFPLIAPFSSLLSLRQTENIHEPIHEPVHETRDSKRMYEKYQVHEPSLGSGAESVLPNPSHRLIPINSPITSPFPTHFSWSTYRRTPDILTTSKCCGKMLSFDLRANSVWCALASWRLPDGVNYILD